MDAEKRRRTRIPLKFDCSIFSGTHSVAVETRNVSLTGMSCASTPYLEENSPCRVVFTLSREIKITILGRVVRKNDDETGIFFDKMDDESFYHLKRLVQYNTEDPDRIEDELIKPR